MPRCVRRVCAVLFLLSAAAPAAHAARTTRSPSAVPPDTLYARQDWPAAAAAYAAVTAAEPANGRAWYRLGVALAQSGHPDRAIPAYRRAAALRFAPVFTRYNLVCAYALTHANDEAFETLDSLLSLGYRQTGTLETDPDLASLRGDSRFATALEHARRNATPCAYAPESRQFDFWVGEWDVQDRASGTPAGRSSVQHILGDCVVFENWTGLAGGSGKSINAYNHDTGAWTQDWADDSGIVTHYTEGAYRDSAMTFLAHGRNPDGTPLLRRLTFFDLPGHRVRQFAERSVDGGTHWTVDYDFLYLERH